MEREFHAGPRLDEYSEYLRLATTEPARSRGWYALILLTLGMALRLDAKAAARTPERIVSVAADLLALRRRSELLMPEADFARECIFRFGFATPAERLEPALVQLDRLPRLLGWLVEFDEEAACPHHWHRYLLSAENERVVLLLP